jgi:hypothetical protein
MHPITDKIQFYGAVGVVATRMHLTWENTYDSSADGGAGGAPNANAAARRTKSLDVRKTLPMAKIGIYVPITNSFALRFITTWSKTSKIQYYVPSSDPNTSITLQGKNTLQYSLGFVYRI